MRLLQRARKVRAFHARRIQSVVPRGTVATDAVCVVAADVVAGFKQAGACVWGGKGVEVLVGKSCIAAAGLHAKGLARGAWCAPTVDNPSLQAIVYCVCKCDCECVLCVRVCTCVRL
jgi:hypothetical protein